MDIINRVHLLSLSFIAHSKLLLFSVLKSVQLESAVQFYRNDIVKHSDSRVRIKHFNKHFMFDKLFLQRFKLRGAEIFDRMVGK